MAGITNTSRHGLHVCSPLDFRCSNQQSTHKNKGVWWNVGQATVGNTSVAGRWIWIDNGCDIGQVLSELSRLPYQIATEMVKTIQRRNRACVVGHKSNCWYQQTNWIPGHKKDSIFCPVSRAFGINWSHKVSC